MGKFGKATIAISATATGVLLMLLVISVFVLMKRRTEQINYIVGTTILFCMFFELVAVVVGVIALFEKPSRKGRVAGAMAVSAVCFVGVLTILLSGVHHHQ